MAGATSRRVEDLIDRGGLNAHESLVARLLGTVAQWFEETYGPGPHGAALWDLIQSWALAANTKGPRHHGGLSHESQPTHTPRPAKKESSTDGTSPPL